MTTRKAATALLAAAALGIGACGDEDDPVTATPEPAATSAATTPQQTATTPEPAAGASIQKLEISQEISVKPAIAKPTGDPPSKLYSRDIIKGKGASAKAGDKIAVQYVGVSYSTGEQFDASWDLGKAFQFQLGAQMVIPGWDEGVVGMRPGGRRMLVIPPDLAYGATGQGSIAPNETLIFVIDLESIA